MRCITLTQPWASLVAIGAKTIETRSWATPHRGPLAIHAAKSMPAWARDFAEDLDQCSRIEYGFEMPIELPLGAIVATCRLVDVIPTRKQSRIPGLTDQEHDFGDFTYGRYAWVLTDVVALSEPIPWRGQLGLWEWEQAGDWLDVDPVRPVRSLMQREMF